MGAPAPVYSRPKMKDFSLFSPPSCSTSVYRESWVYKTQLCCASNRMGSGHHHHQVRPVFICGPGGGMMFTRNLAPPIIPPFFPRHERQKFWTPPNVKKAGQEASSHFRRRQIQKKKINNRRFDLSTAHSTAANVPNNQKPNHTKRVGGVTFADGKKSSPKHLFQYQIYIELMTSRANSQCSLDYVWYTKQKEKTIGRDTQQLPIVSSGSLYLPYFFFFFSLPPVVVL